MPFAITDDGVKVYYEETGTGTPVVFVHEFAGDYRSWEMTRDPRAMTASMTGMR